MHLPRGAPDERGLPRFVCVLEDLRNEELRLPNGEPAANHDRRRWSLVATWQRCESDRRARREHPQADVRLNGQIQRLDQQEAPADPALVPLETASDLALREPVLPVERAHEPGLLELGETTTIVERGDLHLGVGDVEILDRHAERPVAKNPRRVEPLEPVDDLERLTLAERDDRGDLPVPRERAAHRLEHAGVAKTERTEPITEGGDRHLCLERHRDHTSRICRRASRKSPSPRRRRPRIRAGSTTSTT